MSPAKAHALPAFHALIGSDNTSFFSGTGKRSAHKATVLHKNKGVCVNYGYMSLLYVVKVVTVEPLIKATPEIRTLQHFSKSHLPIFRPKFNYSLVTEVPLITLEY